MSLADYLRNSNMRLKPTIITNVIEPVKNNVDILPKIQMQPPKQEIIQPIQETNTVNNIVEDGVLTERDLLDAIKRKKNLESRLKNEDPKDRAKKMRDAKKAQQEAKKEFEIRLKNTEKQKKIFMKDSLLKSKSLNNELLEKIKVSKTEENIDYKKELDTLKNVMRSLIKNKLIMDIPDEEDIDENDDN